MEYMYFGGDLVPDVERAYFKKLCIYVPSDDSVHTVGRITGILIFLSIYF